MINIKIKKITNTNISIITTYFLAVILLAIPSFINAQSTILVSEIITKSTLNQGYSIISPNQDLEIKIAPNSLNRSIFTELIKPEFYPSVPLDKTRISNVYYYSILPTTNNKLWEDISITFKYPLNETRYREIYIYNGELSEWTNLPGNITLANQTLTTSTNWASGFIAVFADHLDKSEYLKEKINSPSMLIADIKTGEILVERESSVIRPIASLTKLMTTAVFLDNNPGWDKRVSMKAADDTIPSKIYVRNGDTFTTHDLFYATLVKSANNAANALARSTGLTHDQFVQKMNEKAKLFGMNNTHFEEVTGLSKKNVSTAADYFILTKKLFSSMTFLQATTQKYFTIATVDNRKKYRMKNSNKLLNVPYTVLGSKTGFTYEAGRCLAMKVKNKQGREVLAITLGANKFGAHWDDMRTLLDATLGE